MKYKTLLFTLVAVIVFTFFSCKEDLRKSPKKLLEEEQELLDRFKLTETYKNWILDAEMVADSSSSSGLVYFQLEKGTGDTVQVGKSVGFRYNMYVVADSVGAILPFIYKRESNWGYADPSVYIAGQPNTYSGIYFGLDLGIRYMNRNGKSRMLVPSPIGGNDYVTRVYEVEVTYVGR